MVDAKGDLATPDEAYAGVTGDLDVLILRWQGEPLDGLKHLAALSDVDDLLALEIDRLLNPVLPPKGWEYLWFIGPAETYRSCAPTGMTEPSAAIPITTPRS